MSKPPAGDLGARPSRWPHEIMAEPPPDGRLPPLRSLEKLAARKAQLAEAALARAKRARQAAEQALLDAREALQAHVRFVAEERQRLLAERQASTDSGGQALRVWRQQDQALIDSIPRYREAVTARERELRAAEDALGAAQAEQRIRARRREKFDLLIEQIEEEA